MLRRLAGCWARHPCVALHHVPGSPSAWQVLHLQGHPAVVGRRAMNVELRGAAGAWRGTSARLAGYFFFLISGGGNEDAKKGRFGPSADT